MNSKKDLFFHRYQHKNFLGGILDMFFIGRMKTIICVMFCSLVIGDSAFAFEQGDWLVRLRAMEVMPTNHNGRVKPIEAHASVKVGNSLVPELDISYMWTRNIGTELVLATSRHSITGTKALHGKKIGRSWVLPPCLVLQYHFCPCSDFQPYLGVGVNYTLFYDKHCSIDETHLHLKNSWGVVGQVGFDYMLNQCWFVNFDVKYIQMHTKARLNGGLNAHVDVGIDPWALSIGIGRVF